MATQVDEVEETGRASGYRLGRLELRHDFSNPDAKYWALLETAPDAMLVVNETLEIVLLNAQAERSFGYDRNEVIGQRVKHLIPRGLEECLAVFGSQTEVEAFGQPVPAGVGVELCGRCRDGSEFPIEIVLGHPLQSDEGVLVTAAIRDITQRKQAEASLLHEMAELRRSNEELERFAYVASCGLREPLRMVTRLTQLLARRYRGKLDADADEFLAFALDGATRMERLIQDLLTCSRLAPTIPEFLAMAANAASADTADE